jgi:hypothetical protein
MATFLYAVLKIQRIRPDLQQGKNQRCTLNVQIGTWRQVTSAVQISGRVCRYLRGLQKYPSDCTDV